VPATLVFIAPDIDLKDLATFNKDGNCGVDYALWARDPANIENISTRNTLQLSLIRPNGQKPVPLPFRDVLKELGPLLKAPEAGTFRLPVTGLTDAKSLDLWWQVERQRPDAIKNLVAVEGIKKKGPLQADAAKILAVVKEAFAKRETELVAAPATMATYEELERLLTEGQGLELKQATARYKELTKAKEMKDEIQARAIYRKCQELLASPRPDPQAEGRAGLAMLIKKFANTMYGKKAALAK
jgi:hypothetical protein